VPATGQANMAAGFFVPSDTDEVRIRVILARESSALRHSQSRPLAEQTVQYRVR
jgi:hypothetical protein